MKSIHFSGGPSRTRSPHAASSRSRFLGPIVATFAVLALSACASGPQMGDDGPSDMAAAATENDPLEPVNRAVHAFNQTVDHGLVRPVAYGYRGIVPENVRVVIRSLLRHLTSPVILANDLLQGDLERAGNTAMRLWINTTLGAGGLADVATPAGFPYHDEDFGQTLAVHGVGSGPYVVLPLLGPSTARDAVGRAVDWFIDPLRMYTAAHNPGWEPTAGPGRTVATVVDTREALLDPIEEIERSSLDVYASFRSLYLQRRAAAIANQDSGRPGASPTPMVDGSAFDFDE